MTALGVVLSDDLGVYDHVNKVPPSCIAVGAYDNGHVNNALASCPKSFYAIRILKSHGLPVYPITNTLR